jgi:hypothetical protein
MRPSNRITSLTTASTDSSLVTSRGSIANDRWLERIPRLLVP